MDKPVFVAIISAAAVIVASAVSFYLTKWKERQADWQRYKFELYKEFVESISGAVGMTPHRKVLARGWTCIPVLYAGCSNHEASGKSRRVIMRYGCNLRLREACYQWARTSVQPDANSQSHYKRLQEAGHSPLASFARRL